jgi:hypothetical protein
LPVVEQASPPFGASAMKRLALLALLVASSCVVATPAPLPKPKRKPEPPKKVAKAAQADEPWIDVGPPLAEDAPAPAARKPGDGPPV